MISFCWGIDMSSVVKLSIDNGWKFSFYGFTFGQIAIGFIKRHKWATDNNLRGEI